ncbi:hypothetical protein FRC08_009897 [Ceratobasidium sp. 394]|nr:hypothetical protein FRC08_009897 [Ceratobasidium sp. 394]
MESDSDQSMTDWMENGGEEIEEEFINVDELIVGVDMLIEEHLEELEQLSSAGPPEQTASEEPSEPSHNSGKKDQQFYTHWDYKQIALDISELPEQDVNSRNTAVRRILRAINTLEQQKYWWAMCEPKLAKDEAIAREVLGQPPTSE